MAATLARRPAGPHSSRPLVPTLLRGNERNIGNTLQEIYRESQRSNLATHLVADRMAEERMGVSSNS